MLAVAAVLSFADDAPLPPPPPPPAVAAEPPPRADQPPADAPTATGATLSARLLELEQSKPSLVGPIVMMSVGTVLMVPGAGFLYLTIALAAEIASGTGGGLAAGLGAIFAFFTGLGTVVFLGAGLVLAIIGTVQLVGRVPQRSAIDAQIEQLRKRPIDEIGPPPPAPPPPPEAHLVRPMLVPVAVF